MRGGRLLVLVEAVAMTAGAAGVAGVRARGVNAGVTRRARTVRTAAIRLPIADRKRSRADREGTQHRNHRKNSHPSPSRHRRLLTSGWNLTPARIYVEPKFTVSVQRLKGDISSSRRKSGRRHLFTIFNWR